MSQELGIDGPDWLGVEVVMNHIPADARADYGSLTGQLPQDIYELRTMVGTEGAIVIRGVPLPGASDRNATVTLPDASSAIIELFRGDEPAPMAVLDFRDGILSVIDNSAAVEVEPGSNGIPLAMTVFTALRIAILQQKRLSGQKQG